MTAQPDGDHSEAAPAVLVAPPDDVSRGVVGDAADDGKGNAEGGGPSGEGGEMIQQPAKVMRIGSMVKQLLDEVRVAQLDESSRKRMREIHEQSIRELAGALSPDLADELDRMARPFDQATPSEAELRVAQAQLVGWLEGLFHGIQASLMAQQLAARAQLDEMRQRRMLPPGVTADQMVDRPGTYL